MASSRDEAECRRTDIRLRVLACYNTVREIGRFAITSTWDEREQIPCLTVMNRIHATWRTIGPGEPS